MLCVLVNSIDSMAYNFTESFFVLFHVVRVYYPSMSFQKPTVSKTTCLGMQRREGFGYNKIFYCD